MSLPLASDFWPVRTGRVRRGSRPSPAVLVAWLLQVATLALAQEVRLSPGTAREDIADPKTVRTDGPILQVGSGPVVQINARVASHRRGPLVEVNPRQEVRLAGAAPKVSVRLPNPFSGLNLKLFDLNAFGLVSVADEGGYRPIIDPRTTLVRSSDSVFKRDPVYDDTYNAEEQLYIYGGKHPDRTARPLIELGRELYQFGPLKPGVDLFGKRNLVFPQFLVFGDLRTAVAYNDNGGDGKGVLAVKLNLDVDLRITATERIHAFFTPFDRDGQVTRLEFGGSNRDSRLVLNAQPSALFFEGDLARIIAGATDQENKFDIPFTFGLIPLITQNGVWLQDAFNGFAFTIPARNSPSLGISNADFTFFAGFDAVTSRAIANDHSADIFGVAGFVEVAQGYLEFGYGYTLGRKDFDDLSYHNLSAAFTRRYFDTISNSVRVIANVGQEPDSGHRRTADGVLILLENSLITEKPLTLVPYLNLFAGFNKPQSLARALGAGGVLVNTGLSFETDGVTGFPKLDESGHDTYGGALGVEYLFSFDQQIVFEVAGLNTFGDDKDRFARGYELAFSARYQKPLNNAWILRADFIAATRDRDQDLLGLRVELRRKF